MVSACVEVEVTRDIARQILRHRSFSFQEFSQRYADPTKDLDFVLREARLQDTKNRQNSIEVGIETEDDRFLIAEWNRRQQEVIDLVKENYTWAVGAGIAKEQARAILPEGNTVSRMYINGTLRSFIHYIEVRSEKATQKEHREMAIEIAKVIAEVFPLAQEFVSK
jgi:thymidylate synthase (FAD)